MEKLPYLDELEQQVRTHTIERERATLIVIEQLLNLYLAGFGLLGQFKKTDNNRPEQVWVLLTSRAFSSMRWAYHLLQCGYYSQSLILTRAVWEDWLVCFDCIEHSDTAVALLDGDTPWTYKYIREKSLRFSDMADRLPELLKQQWQGHGGGDGVYGALSTFSHPRHHALAAAVSRASNTLRVKPDYDRDLFLVSSYTLLQGAVRMMEFLVRLLPPDTTDWQVQCSRLIERAHTCLNALNSRATRTEDEPN